MEEVELFGFWSSPFSRRIELALKLKGIPYKYIEEDLSNKSPLLLQYNPVHKKIPVLVHNGKPIAESLVILEYIEETWKSNPLLPQDPYERAMARFWAKFIDETILGMGPKIMAATGEDRKKAVEEISNYIKVLENELEGKEFFGGDMLGYVDVVATVVGIWFPVSQEAAGGLGLMSEEMVPMLYKWIGKLTEIDAVNECRPPREKHLEYIKGSFCRPKTCLKKKDG